MSVAGWACPDPDVRTREIRDGAKWEAGGLRGDTCSDSVYQSAAADSRWPSVASCGEDSHRAGGRDECWSGVGDSGAPVDRAERK